MVFDITSMVSDNIYNSAGFQVQLQFLLEIERRSLFYFASGSPVSTGSVLENVAIRYRIISYKKDLLCPEKTRMDAMLAYPGESQLSLDSVNSRLRVLVVGNDIIWVLHCDNIN